MSVTAGVSCVIPAFRSAETIARAVTSCIADDVIGQVIVVVDGPDPAIEAAIPALPSVERIVLPRNEGSCAARNAGLSRVAGDIVMFLDADDYIDAELASGLRDALIEHQADVALGRFRREWPATGEVVEAFHFDAGPLDPLRVLRNWLAGNFVPPCAVAWRTASLRAIGGWDASLGRVSRDDDGELIRRAIFRGLRFAGADRGIATYVQHDAPTRISRRTDRATYNSVLHVLEKSELEIRSGPFEAARPELAKSYYLLARAAYRYGYLDIGDDAIRRARKLGFAGHLGTLSHRLTASLIGLRQKERLAAATGAARSAFRRPSR
jgi:glycosyltransferase involved in cell wall biosynthesis